MQAVSEVTMMEGFLAEMDLVVLVAVAVVSRN
jgi:hypothetical protein